MILFHKNLVTSLSFIVAKAFTSTHFVKQSIVTNKNLFWAGATGK